MLKEIPETLMLCAFDPLQHDLGTDMGTDGFMATPHNGAKRTVLQANCHEQDGLTSQ